MALQCELRGQVGKIPKNGSQCAQPVNAQNDVTTTQRNQIKISEDGLILESERNKGDMPTALNRSAIRNLYLQQQSGMDLKVDFAQ
jgi:hypothetical protein